MRSLRSRALLFTVVLAALGGALIVAQTNRTSGQKMAEAATKLSGTFTVEQKKQAVFAFDDEHRTTWYFTPVQENKKSIRKGLRMDGLSANQKTAMLDLLKLGLSTKGFEQASSIMDLESYLAELEGAGGAMTRNPQWYFVSIFGEPSNTGKWGWRIEGHHLSVNFTLDKGEVVSATPMVFGVNPAEIKAGPKKGQRVVPEVEDLAKELIVSLNDNQMKIAGQAKQFGEIQEKQANATVGDPVGIPAKDLSADQKKTLRKLVEAYANRLPDDLAASEMKKVDAGDFNKVHFAYCMQEQKDGAKPFTYRVQGPSFVIEFLNVQTDAAKNPANHIHSGWRSLPKDFGK